MYYNYYTMKRPITSFEQADDVGVMLRRAKSGGIKVGHLCNEALRRYLTEKGFAHKRDPEPKKKSKALSIVR